jgi:hypothetical protein
LSFRSTPSTCLAAPVSEVECSEAKLHLVFEFSFIHSSVIKNDSAVAVELAVDPKSLLELGALSPAHSIHLCISFLAKVNRCSKFNCGHRQAFVYNNFLLIY